MFSLKLITISKSKIFMDHVINYCGKRCLWTLTIDHCINIKSNRSLSHLVNYSKKFDSEVPQKDYNVFGNISYDKYETVEMDEDEKKEEIFAESAKIPKYERLNYQDCIRLIKSYMSQKNLELALGVLDVMKENSVKPNLFVYRLLISAFAVQGDITQCFKLFKKLKDSGLKPSPHVYTSLIEACAKSKNKELALDRLQFLRTYCYQRKIHLNVMQYCALIKAYGHHKETKIAFEVADEARDNKCDLSSSMIASLFHAAIGDTKSGLKYALTLWHTMKKNKMKISIYHYNLILRAIQCTKFGNLKTSDVLLSGSYDTRIQFKDVERSDLLDSPPVISISCLTSLKESSNMPHPNTNEIDIVHSVESLSLYLDNVLETNQLFLFGGAEKFLNRMKENGVQPDVKTLTLILDLLPSSLEAENKFLKYIKRNFLDVDIVFFNMLIKKRCMRNCYEDAKSTLREIQRYHLEPNVVTFGSLAIGCKNFRNGAELLEQMDNIGYVANNIILETLLLHACSKISFSYISYLMAYISNNQIKPSKAMLEMLDEFETRVLKRLNNQVERSSERNFVSKAAYNKFKIKYDIWKEKLEMSEN
nr:PREDICTED: pentatricopeptide repeat-containing protein 1, mitochondrial [Megachile rotundata]